MDQEKHSVSRNLWYWNGRVFFKKNIFTYGLAAFLLVAVPVVLVVVMQLSYQGHRIVKLNEQTSYQNRSITKLNEQISHQDQRIAKLNEQISYQDQRITVLIERMENCTSVQDETISHSLKTEVHDLHSGFVTETLEKVEQRIQQLNQSLSQVLSQSDESLLKLQLSATSVHAQFQGEIEELHRLYQTLQTNLSSVSASEDALAQKIKRMKNIFGNCQTTVDTCDIGSTGNSRYWKACPTHFFQKEKQVSYFSSVCCNVATLL